MNPELDYLLLDKAREVKLACAQRLFEQFATYYPGPFGLMGVEVRLGDRHSGRVFQHAIQLDKSSRHIASQIACAERSLVCLMAEELFS